MSRIFLKFLILTVFFSIKMPTYGRCQQTPDHSEQKIKAMLKEFYSNYITLFATSVGVAAEKKIDSLKKEYCTQRLLLRIKKQKLDYDPFLKAQDSDVAFLKTLTIIQDKDQQATYVVSYTDWEGKKITIPVSVIRQKEAYKIDAIF